MFQTRWNEDSKLDKYIDDMLKLLNDDKSVVVRKCIEALHELLIFKDYSLKAEKALNNIDLNKYKDTMAPSIQKDIEV